ncbi:serine/threonine-protein kinase [Streptomyces sp. DSM 44917]|uniref:non-specific serine/threonine protein kinase n=1 Tax=Streptomyces boetiae TaxID=3075541 RepID=A0ABU2LGB9_9ACTN|nr:serine/threonine-protein kinase [Streptomyces sp. DSM 44917]MDT0310634.1 serine/threonine-protein kinase [Streptomyces sp. DSM 44917]
MNGRLLAGRYQLTEPLGKGGMGEVWSGRDTALGGRRVAVKLLHADRLASLSGTTDPEELRRRFLRECRVTARIDHPGLVAVHDAGQDGEELFLVMQLVEGSDLADHLAEHDPYPWPWAVAVLAQLCSALSAVHAVPVVHRDLKPGNVMVRPDGRVTILDLGIAAARGDGEDTRLTRTGTLLGTPVYMAPEQAVGEPPVSPAADLYALGAIGYELLTGRVPFSAPNAAGLLYKKLHEEPAPLLHLRPDAPPPLAGLVHRLLATDPGQRPADARHVFDVLAALLPRPTAAPVPMDPTRPFSHPLAPWPPPRPAEPDLTAALDEIKRLLSLGHYPQVAELIGRTLPQAAARYGEASPVVRALRKQYAATLLDTAQYARALPEIQRLAHEFTAERGPYDPVVVQLRADERLCLRQLAQTTGFTGRYGPVPPPGLAP